MLVAIHPEFEPAGVVVDTETIEDILSENGVPDDVIEACDIDFQPTVEHVAPPGAGSQLGCYDPGNIRIEVDLAACKGQPMSLSLIANNTLYHELGHLIFHNNPSAGTSYRRPRQYTAKAIMATKALTTVVVAQKFGLPQTTALAASTYLCENFLAHLPILQRAGYRISGDERHANQFAEEHSARRLIHIKRPQLITFPQPKESAEATTNSDWRSLPTNLLTPAGINIILLRMIAEGYQSEIDYIDAKYIDILRYDMPSLTQMLTRFRRSKGTSDDSL